MFVRLSAAIAALSLLGSAALAQGAKPTDPQIAHIAYTAGVIDIAAAKQAMTKASNKEVKAFAQDMVRDHEAVNKQALDLVKKLKVTPGGQRHQQGTVEAGRRQARRARQAEGRRIRQGLCRQRGRLSQDSQRRAGDAADPVGQQCRAEESAADRPEDFQGHQQHAEHVAADPEVGRTLHAAWTASPDRAALMLGDDRRPGACGNHSDRDGESRGVRRPRLRPRSATPSNGSTRTCSSTPRPRETATST